MNFKSVSTCTVCGSRNINAILNLPNYPLTEFLHSSAHHDEKLLLDNKVYFCLHCQHGFLMNQIDPLFLYGESYKTKSKSPSSMGVLNRFIKYLVDSKILLDRDFIVDIGANDGSLLNLIQKLNLDIDLFGIDPVWENTQDISGFRGFLNECDINSISKSKKNRLFIATHVLEHISSPIETLNTLYGVMNSNDKVILIFPALEPLFLESRIESIHHQHLQYFSYNSFARLIKGVGLSIVESWIDFDHYGAACVVLEKLTTNQEKSTISKDKWKEFSYRFFSRDMRDNYVIKIEKSVNLFSKNIELINENICSRNIVGLGGGALMSPIIFYHLKPWESIKAIYDDNEEKKGWHWANTPHPIEKTPSSLDGLDVLLIGSVSKLTGRLLFDRASKLNANSIIFPTIGA